MLNEFLFWWLRQLRSLLPAPLRGEAARRNTPRLLLAPGLDTLTVPGRSRADPPRTVPLAPEDLARLRATVAAPVELELPPGRMLAHEVSLPLAAERDPGQVLRFEMDRLTPFAAGDLHWGWSLLRRDRAAATIAIRLLLVPQAPLRPVLDALSRAGLRPTALRSGLDAIPLGATPGHARGRRVRTGLVAACAVLAVLAAAIPFARQSLEAGRLEARIAAARPAVEQADAIRRAAQAAAAGTDVLAAQRAESGEILLVLAALTAALGDDSHLTDLAFRARTATVSGASAAAVRLIPTLTAQPALAGTSFTAPVTRIDAAGTEGFTLRTEQAP